MQFESQCFNKSILEYVTFPEYDMLYTDPPWGDGMVKFFITQKEKDTGRRDAFDLNDILTKLAALSITDKPMFIEYSIKGHEHVIEVMQSAGHTFCSKKELRQTNSRPYVILVFNSEYCIKDGLIGFDVVRGIVKSLRPSVVFDPFAGIGKTAAAVIESGSGYVGSEFNMARFDRLKNVIETAENRLKWQQERQKRN